MVTTGSGTRAFLFADLRGYTRYVDAHGDAAAAELLADYRALTRGVIGRHDGAEIRTEGDGIYVVFESVAAAVDAGLELVDAAGAASAANPARPIRVAVGIHAGETTATDEGPVGSAVNIAARICAKAEAGEVLVSGTVRDLVRTARPYRATSLGPQRLKGVAEAIPIFRLETAPSGRRSRLVRRARARRRLLALIAAAMVVAVVASGAALALSRPPDCLTLAAGTQDVLARIDTQRGCVMETIPVGRRPGAVVVTEDAIWVADRDSWTVTRVDRATPRGVIEQGLPGSPLALAADPAGDLEVLAYADHLIERGAPETNYAASGLPRTRLVRIIGATGSVWDAWQLNDVTNIFNGFRTRGGYSSIAIAMGWAWVSSPGGAIVRVRQLGRIDVDLSSSGVVRPEAISSSGPLWVADGASPLLVRIDGPESAPVPVPLNGTVGSTAMQATAVAVWLLRADGTVTRLAPASGSQATLQVEGRPSALAVDGDQLWLTDQGERVVRRVDETDGTTLATIGVGGIPAAVAVDGTDLWVTIAGS